MIAGILVRPFFCSSCAFRRPEFCPTLSLAAARVAPMRNVPHFLRGCSACMPPLAMMSSLTLKFACASQLANLHVHVLAFSRVMLQHLHTCKARGTTCRMTYTASVLAHCDTLQSVQPQVHIWSVPNR